MVEIKENGKDGSCSVPISSTARERGPPGRWRRPAVGGLRCLVKNEQSLMIDWL